MYQRYQPLPISTGAVGVDRCGNVVAYAAPRVVYARACWQHWPICPQPWPWPQPFPFPGAGCSCCSGSGGAFASVLMGGAAMANWMINAPKPAAATTKAAA